MGSAPSTPNQERTDDPWWPIERQNLTLNPNEINYNIINNNNNLSENIQNNLNSLYSAMDAHNPIHLDASASENVTNERNLSNDQSDELSCDEIVENEQNEMETNMVEIDETPKQHSKVDQTLEEFKEELRIKREMRQTAIAELRNEIQILRSQLADEKALNKRLISKRNGSISDSDDEIDELSPQIHLVSVQLDLQKANSEILTLTEELMGTRKQVAALKQAVSVSKEMVEIRETQLTQLKAKLVEIEKSLVDREAQLMAENLRKEYDRQLNNIRNLRALYEERSRISAAEKENLNRQLETSRIELQAEKEKNQNLEEHIASIDTDLKSTSADLYGTREQLDHYKAENRNLHDEMTVINQLFSQLLAGFNGCNNIDIDKLTNVLEENRELLSEMTNREDSHEGAAQLPKLFFDLVTQADRCDGITFNSGTDSDSNASSSNPKMSSAQEIVSNLPKVWKVLIELLNHQEIKPVEINENGSSEDCYNSVQTPTGPQLVLSVSKTYIKLKDLIVEKKFLQKETRKLKNLNSHLGTRLEQQERRLGTVSVELNKTWNLVGRMQRQRRQLHTQEQVLRYHLQQKRRLLSELKDELEYCRRKWALAKEKNKESQCQWDALRLEFSKRKELDSNNSAESGYSDGPASEDDDDDVIKNAAAISATASQTIETKRKGNKEKFLLKVEKGGRKAHRIHSVSPIRCAKIIHEISRRNSETHVPQFATEIFQAMPIEVEPIELLSVTSESLACVEVAGCSGLSNLNKSIALSTSSVKTGAKPKRGICDAKKLLETKTGIKTNFEKRKELKSSIDSSSTSKHGESLEEMFSRLSGQEVTENITNENMEKTSVISVSKTVSEEEKEEEEKEGAEEVEKEVIEPLNTTENIDVHLEQRNERIQRLQEECESLLTQVTNTSSKGDELNRQADEILERFTLLQSSEPTPSTSTGYSKENELSNKTDEECLSQTEREYTSHRSERLARLEAESQAFLERMNQRVNRATTIDNQVEYLHGRYNDETSQTEENNAPESSTDNNAENEESSDTVPDTDNSNSS